MGLAWPWPHSQVGRPALAQAVAGKAQLPATAEGVLGTSTASASRSGVNESSL